MHIFNNGKYKSLHAQSEGELEQIRQTVLSDQDFYPSYHLAPPTGLLNDPNGLIFDGEKYHIFYQWFPYDAIHGMKHWKHFTTTDFHHFKACDPLIPDEMFESHGCYSGGAILWEDRIVAFYTGNTRRLSDNQRIPHQNIAIFSKEGKLLEKRCILNAAPNGYTEHVRDPKPFVTKEGKIRFVLGAQRENLTGTALLYEMDNLNSEPKLLGELNVSQFDNQNVFMWECPDLFKLANQDIFIWSPQGKAREKKRFQNNYHATFAVGKLEETKFNTLAFDELDFGFDFYAPQTVQNAEGILFGWVGLPDLTYPTDPVKWHSALSLPRQLSLKNNKIQQKPLDSIYSLFTQQQQIELNGKQKVTDLDTSYLQISVKNQPLALRLFENNQGHYLALNYQNGILTLDRTHSEQTELMEKFGSQRHCEIENLEKLEIFFDRSIIEIFVNDGEKVLTSRFFIRERSNIIESYQPLNAIVAKVGKISYL